ncbi:unnamed protein product, partial [Ectocarpus sp. 6 AP-2014]
AVGNASAAVDGGLREARSHPVGRWMAAGKRPVLCLAHARVWPSATHQQQQQLQQQQHEVLDLIATGDTGGTVTVWQFFGGGGGGGSTLPSDQGEFVYRGPAGRRRGGAARTGPEGAAAPPCHALVPVLEYRAHQMGVLCMAVHVPAGERGRVVVVTGGDDQAICVAELEVAEVLDDGRRSPTTIIASDRGRSSSLGPRGQGGDEVPARKRRSAVRLVAGSPQVIEGAAGSAIKGMQLLPAEPPPPPKNPLAKLPGPSTESPITMQSPTPSAGIHDDDAAVAPSPSSRSVNFSSSSSTTPTVDPGVGAGAVPPCSLSLFTVARDQRLSRWDLVKDGSSSSSSSSSFGSVGDSSSSEQQQQPATTPAGTNDRRAASEPTTPRRRDDDDGGAVGGSSCCPSGGDDGDRDPLRARRRRPMLSP